MHDLTCPGIKPQTYCSNSDVFNDYTNWFLFNILIAEQSAESETFSVEERSELLEKMKVKEDEYMEMKERLKYVLSNGV